VIDQLAAGLSTTVSLIAFAWGIGFPIGYALAFLGANDRAAENTINSVSTAFTLIPFLVILFWLHYPLQSMLGVVWPPFWTAAGLLSFYVLVAVGDILSHEMVRLRIDLNDVAQVLDIPDKIYLRRVVLPAAWNSARPRLLFTFVSSIHMTMFASLIGVEEIFRVVQRLNAQYLMPVELFSIMAVIYIVICLPFFVIGRLLEHRARRR